MTAQLPGTNFMSQNGIGGMPSSVLPNDPPVVGSPYGRLDASLSPQPLDVNSYLERTMSDEFWTWQILPSGLMYKSDIANQREPRFASQVVHDSTQGWLWDVTLGGHVGLLRYGTENDAWPQGYQVDIEGAAYPRLNGDRSLVSNDYSFGVPLTTRQGPWEFKVGYNHYCSHIGDLFLIANPGYQRINYVRETLFWGIAFYASPTLRLYEENGWAFHTDGGAEPWEFRVGADFCSFEPTGGLGTPFFGICAHLRQENDFGGNLDVQTGWLWRGRNGQTFRVGMQYFNGMSEQAQFFNRFEQQIGAGVWYDY